MRKKTGNLKSYLITICLGLLLTVSSVITVLAEQAAQGEQPSAGWSLIEDRYYYLTESGQYLRNAITPDGYYVNPDGVWQPRSSVILGIEFRAPEKVPSVTDAWTGTQEIKTLQGKLQNVFRQRRIRITESAMEYLEGEDETVLLGIYKNTASGSYRLSIRTALDKSSTELNQASSYDYAVFRAFLCQLTTTPDYLEDAIYSSWREDNRWNINRMNGVWVGDSMVKYSAGDGCGYFHICPGGQK